MAASFQSPRLVSGERWPPPIGPAAPSVTPRREGGASLPPRRLPSRSVPRVLRGSVERGLVPALSRRRRRLLLSFCLSARPGPAAPCRTTAPEDPRLGRHRLLAGAEEPEALGEALRRARRARGTGVAAAPVAAAQAGGRPAVPRSRPAGAARESARTPSPTLCSGPAR